MLEPGIGSFLSLQSLPSGCSANPICFARGACGQPWRSDLHRGCSVDGNLDIDLGVQTEPPRAVPERSPLRFRTGQRRSLSAAPTRPIVLLRDTALGSSGVRQVAPPPLPV